MISTAPAAPASDDEIDLSKVGAALARQWRSLAAGAGFGLAAAGLITATSPRVWQVEFQIVLSDDKGGSGLRELLSQAGGLAGILGGGAVGGMAGAASGQETEQTVLQSPSVLLPVFDYVKSQLPPQQAQRLRFRGWAKGSVKVNAEKGTSVLNVTYSGSPPALVLAAGRKLADTYQAYSGRKRERNLRALMSYLQEQIAAYRPRADASRARAEAFANRYTLTAADAVPASSGNGIDLGGGLEGLLSGISSSITAGVGGGSIKGQQEELHKRIRELGFQLARVRAASDREPVVFNNNFGPLANLPGNGSLQDLDRLIAERRSRFQDSDPSITILRRQRQVLVGSINRQLAQELENSIALAQSQLGALQRPPGVVEQFQKLSREANRDQEILQKLENALAEQQLELARDGQPWEVISSPTLLDKPLSPRPAVNLAAGLLLGLVGGAGTALVRERRSGRLFASDELLELLPYPLLGQLSGSHPESWRGVLELLAHGPLQGCPQVALIAAGELDGRGPQLAQALQEALQQRDPAAQVLLGSDLLQASRCQAQLLVACLGLAQRQGLSQLQQDLQLQGKPVAGLLVLDATNA
ncbi:MAG: hypothetical protein FJ060_08485 [Cyanobacteria bacterium K_Offshore_0m_m2_072]|nr:hypothetical protein [Cyanobacteria bacterium K_Offshore_0m_m2_072]